MGNRKFMYQLFWQNDMQLQLIQPEYFFDFGIKTVAEKLRHCI